MKKIINLLVVLLSVGVFTNCSSNSEKQTKFVNEEELVRFEITANTTKEEIIKYYYLLKDERNIIIDHSGSEFDKSGVIKKLELSVNCQDGLNGAVSTTFNLLNTKAYGFQRDYKAGNKRRFKIGIMN